MLATLNSSQIVDAIVKDAIGHNDPHDAVQISPDIIRASRPVSVAPSLAPEIGIRPEPTFGPEAVIKEAKVNPKDNPKINPEPKLGPAAEPPVDATVRVAPSDGLGPPKRSAARNWLRGAFVTFLFAGASAAATIAWSKHGETIRPMLAQWTPALASLLPATSQTAPVAAAPAVAPAATSDQAAAPSAAPQPAAQLAAAAPAATQAPDLAQSVQSLTNDLGMMAQQIEALKASIAELKAGQEQMARDMAKPRSAGEARPPVDARARLSTLPPRAAAPTPPPVRKPKPVVSHTYMPAYAPAPVASAPPPPPAATATTQAVADDDGPVVRPPMPLR